MEYKHFTITQDGNIFDIRRTATNSLIDIIMCKDIEAVKRYIDKNLCDKRRYTSK